MAAFVSSREAASFSRLADSTSALLFIMFASLSLFCRAAADKALIVSTGTTMSSMNTFSIVTPAGTFF